MASLSLIRKAPVSGVVQAVRPQRFDRQGLCQEVLARLPPESASLPTRTGQSDYGQPVHDAQELLRFYSAQLARERASSGTTQSA
jgi:hypothetical protein